MKNFTTLAKIFLTSILLTAVHGRAETCFTNGTEYEQIKKELPAIFQKLPVMFTADSTLLTAGLQIRIADEPNKRLKLDGHIWKPDDIYSDESYVKKICYHKATSGTLGITQDPEFEVTLDNGKSYTIEIDDEDKKVTILSFDFELSSAAKFAGIVEKIKREQKSGSSKAANSKGTN